VVPARRIEIMDEQSQLAWFTAAARRDGIREKSEEKTVWPMDRHWCCDFDGFWCDRWHVRTYASAMTMDFADM
jgi:hypothetical protein